MLPRVMLKNIVDSDMTIVKRLDTRPDGRQVVPPMGAEGFFEDFGMIALIMVVRYMLHRHDLRMRVSD